MLFQFDIMSQPFDIAVTELTVTLLQQGWHAVWLQAKQQGPAPLPCLARAPKAAGQRDRNSGGRQKKVAHEEAHQEGW